MTIFLRIVSAVMDAIIGPMIDARDRSDAAWRKATLDRLRTTLPPLEAIRAELEALDDVFPPELSGPPPRPDAWAARPRARAFLDLLVNGHVARGKVLAYERRGDVDGQDAAAIYAWLDLQSRLRLEDVSASYDPVHAGLGVNVTDACVVSAMAEGMALIIVFDPATKRHVVYTTL